MRVRVRHVWSLKTSEPDLANTASASPPGTAGTGGGGDGDGDGDGDGGGAPAGAPAGGTLSP